MVKSVNWTQVAWNDLEESANYIAQDSRFYAAAFVREVRDAARSLSHFAARGRIVPEFGKSNIREILVRNYRLIYSTSKENINILAFIHGARDLKALWQAEERS